MKVAILSESAADEAALRVLVNSRLNCDTEPIDLPLQSRGWPSVRIVLKKVLLHLHYHSDADALVTVVDSDATPLLPPRSKAGPTASPNSRLNELGIIVREFRLQHAERPHGTPLRIALGLAVPAIEAWYRCGIDPDATEAAWSRALQSKAHARDGRLKLKQRTYGTTRPNLVRETEVAIREATRLTQDLSMLENHFPIGFGVLANEIRTWPAE